MLQGANGYTLNIIGYKCEKKATFLNYIFGGCDINISIGIDFSYSIGPTEEAEIKEAIR
jgi:hypothetical protein